jgi:hypothetical protein
MIGVSADFAFMKIMAMRVVSAATTKGPKPSDASFTSAQTAWCLPDLLPFSATTALLVPFGGWPKSTLFRLLLQSQCGSNNLAGDAVAAGGDRHCNEVLQLGR